MGPAHAALARPGSGACKSLYYLRSKSVQRAAFAGSADKAEVEVDPNQPDLFAAARTDYDECLACQ